MNISAVTKKEYFLLFILVNILFSSLFLLSFFFKQFFRLNDSDKLSSANVACLKTHYVQKLIVGESWTARNSIKKVGQRHSISAKTAAVVPVPVRSTMAVIITTTLGTTTTPITNLLLAYAELCQTRTTIKSSSLIQISLQI